MDPLHQLAQDVHFVRTTVERAHADPTPRRLCFLWAAISCIGFALVDLRDAWVPFYWTIAGPAGFALSAWLGWRYARQRGQVSSDVGTRHFLHWGAMLAAVFLTWLMPLTSATPWSDVGPIILLLLALGYFQAGVHFDAAFGWLGVVLAVGYVFVLVVSAYAWLTFGTIFALALVIVELRASPVRHGSAA